VGFSAAPADGLPRILKAVDYVCEHKGGEGAVRELAEMILDAQGYTCYGTPTKKPKR
jgi:3-deoxy-D-manno-octulosonate 8-phosphate phosphatase KdsC-like HAD superfamily phosphatase